MSVIKKTAWLGLVGIALWWARMMSHAKTPPPEGHWHELTPDEL